MIIKPPIILLNFQTDHIVTFKRLLSYEKLNVIFRPIFMDTLYWKQCKYVTVRPLQQLRSLRI